jgi:hypothetical protein
MAQTETEVRPTHFTFLCGVTKRWAEPTLPVRVEALLEGIAGSQ